jgi:apolipoprotein N-acyltransferase
MIKYGWAGLAGALSVLGFAPFGFYPIPVVALAVLFVFWTDAATPAVAARSGFAFGLGLFGAGVGWIYVSLHDFGDMTIWLSVFVTLIFTSFLALFPAIAGYVQARATFANRQLVMPVVWVLIEMLRGKIFSGFPWLTLGYAQSDSPLSGYAPVIGVYGVSLVAVICSGLLASLWKKPSVRNIFLIVMLWGAGSLLREIDWTTPDGAPFTVSLIQGNIGQDVKFSDTELYHTLAIYNHLLSRNPAKLIVLPETALPLLRDDIPLNLLDDWREQARHNNGDILTGVFEADKAGDYNSVIALGMSEKPKMAEKLPGKSVDAKNSFITEHYRKHHLVMFGEFIPFREVFGWLINQVLHIPMGDLARGEQMQAPMKVAGQRIAVNICYEDVFGEEIIRALPSATLLVNVTNDAWFGNSYAAAQHNQMSQFRAMETGRMMLRATNTGVTSIIGVKGHVLQALTQHEAAVLRGMAQGYAGTTPYVRWGNGMVLFLMALILAGSFRFARKP